MARNLSRRALWMHKLGEEVARGLTAKIESGEIERGAVLADRDALAAEFVTSTSVVDRALDLLIERGLLSAGADGQFHVAQVRPPEHGFELPSAFGEAKADVVSILELRMGVELISAALAAERRSPEALDQIKSARDAFAQAGARGEGIAQADFEFHCAIARASDNPYILELLEYLGPLLIPRMRVALPLDTTGGDQHHAASLAEHAEIVKAIETQDTDAARVAMRGHLTRTIGMVRGIR